MHGSTITALEPKEPKAITLNGVSQNELYGRVKQHAAIARAISKITSDCQNEGYTSPEDAETINLLAEQLHDHLEALASAIINH